MKNYHLYFASCEVDGGIYHYVLKHGMLIFQEKIVCDRPMYLNIFGNELQAVLRAPFSENNESGLVTYKIEDGGKIKQIGEMISTLGAVGCHLCRFEEQTYVANYISGSVFCTSGILDIHKGKGSHLIRQQSPHPHFVSKSPDGKFLLAVDLGLDAVYCYDKSLNVIDIANVPKGHGARHLAFSNDGNFIFCANELESTVTVFSYCNGKLKALETVYVLEKYTENSTIAAIRVMGNYVYVSNRGDDSISCLKWNGERLKLCTVTKCGGNGPRDFIIFDDIIICTNEKSNDVSIMRVHDEKITLSEQKIDMQSPVCVVKK